MMGDYKKPPADMFAMIAKAKAARAEKERAAPCQCKHPRPGSYLGLRCCTRCQRRIVPKEATQ